jgi:hypothetical protein
VRLTTWTASTAAIVLTAWLPARAVPSPQAFPATFERFLAESVQPTSAERNSLLSGAPVTKLMDADPRKEVAIFGAVWISATPADYIRRVQDIEHLERGGGFRVTKRISDPPRLEDFDAMRLSDEDIQDLRHCRLGDCELKLSADALARLRDTIDWSKPTARRDAETLTRQFAFDYVTGYREGGNERLAVYRDRERPTFVASEFRSMVEGMPSLVAFEPSLKDYLLGFPSVTLPDSTSFLYWQEAQFGLKPTIRINHLVIHDGAGATIVANKQLYANHYFWTALEVRALLPDPSRGRGFWFISVNRSRSDGLSGFTGRVIRGRVESEVRKGVASALVATKRTLEGH